MFSFSLTFSDLQTLFVIEFYISFKQIIKLVFCQLVVNNKELDWFTWYLRPTFLWQTQKINYKKFKTIINYTVSRFNWKWRQTANHLYAHVCVCVWARKVDVFLCMISRFLPFFYLNFCVSETIKYLERFMEVNTS